MRVCLVSNEVAGVGGSDLGTYVVEAGHALRAAGHEVWLLTSAPSDDHDRRRRLARHGAFDRVAFVEDVPVEARRIEFARARAVMRFAHLAHEFLRRGNVEFDYVEFTDRGAGGFTACMEQRLFRTYGRTVVAVFLHSPGRELHRFDLDLHALPPSARERCAFEDETIRRAPAAWCSSRHTRGLVARRLRLAEDFADVFPLPMRLDRPSPPPPAAGRKLEELRFLFVGRIEPRSGVRAIVEAFSRMPELRVELVGDDAATSPYGDSEVHWLAKRARENVTFSPPLPPERLAERIRDADVVLLPSTFASWPYTCVAAMAAARVVLGGRESGMAEMIEPGVSGFLVDGVDAGDLERVVREQLGGALDRLDAIGSAAAHRIRELSDPARYAAAIQAFVARHRPAPLAEVADRPLVSVVIPFYNESLTMVGTALDSAIAQDYPSLEFLVVEDGSPREDAAATLAVLAGRDPRVRVLRKPNGGVSSARNHAIAHAGGDVFVFLDADNVLLPGYVRTAMDVFSREPEVMGITPQIEVFEDDTGRNVHVVQGVPYDRPLAVMRNSMGDAGSAFRAAVFRDHGLEYDEMLPACEDWALWLDMAAKGLAVVSLPRLFYRYRIRGGSLMDRLAWKRYLPLLSLMIERHLPPGAAEQEAEQEKDLLAALVHGWGVGPLLAGLGRREEFWEAPNDVAERLHRHNIRYGIVDYLAGVFGRVPGLRRIVGPWIRSAYRAHGRRKDRRRDRE